MRARIHRGAREIGGNCVELDVRGKRLVLDLGRPLDAEPDQKIDLPDIPGLGAPDDGSLWE
jgi:ribonuclease J